MNDGYSAIQRIAQSLHQLSYHDSSFMCNCEMFRRSLLISSYISRNFCIFILSLLNDLLVEILQGFGLIFSIILKPSVYSCFVSVTVLVWNVEERFEDERRERQGMSSLNPSSVLNRRLDSSELATSHSYAFSSTQKLQPSEFPQQTRMLDVDVGLLHFSSVNNYLLQSFP